MTDNESPRQSPNNDGKQNQEGASPRRDQDNKLVRSIKSIAINPEKGKFLDDSIIKFKYYNSFNYSLLARGQDDVTLTLGITSPKQGEGKTLVACNLAVSLAMGSRKNTVLIDLNINNPRLHQVFGVVPSPGLGEALRNGTIHLSQTVIDHLAILPVGNVPVHLESVLRFPAISGLPASTIHRNVLGLDQLAAFRDIIYSLEQEFDFVIVDMPAMNTEEIPVLFANQLNGLLIVVKTGKTKREDLDIMFQHVNQHQVLGFVFNRMSPQDNNKD
jgi:Mrp family chromosome partitioning ATPase